MAPKWLWVLFITVILLEAGWSQGCLEKERIALLQLNSSFNSLPFPRNLVKEEDFDCCRSKGVECDNTTRRVITLHLSFTRSREYLLKNYSSLNGSLFLPFEELKELDLSANHITDITWPSGMSSLESLDLHSNFLNNSFLLNLHSLSSLKILRLSTNEFKGTLQFGGVSNLINLEELYLDGNEIESLQSSQGDGRQVMLINLKELHLSHNLININNTIFSQLGVLFPNLKSLDIDHNQFNGSIDIKELSALSDLENLDMSGNEINEIVTPEAGGGRSLSKLRVLYLDECFTTGSGRNVSLGLLGEAFPSLKTLSLQGNDYLNRTLIPDMQLLSNVEELRLDSSPLSIDFLQSIGVLTRLRILSMKNCGLNGPLPSQGWCHLKNLEELNLNSNALSGIIASCLGNLTSLRSLDISKNHFTGNLASTPLTNLTSLQALSISHNHFQVPLSFSSFANHSKLKVLLLDGNELLSEAVRSPLLFQLKVFSMSSCTVQGYVKELPNFLYFQNDLRYVDISHVNFGRITFPVWLLENNTRLGYLYMDNSAVGPPLLLPSRAHLNLMNFGISNNKIQGHIPITICSLFPNLAVLLMSGNALDGNIPLCFGGMNSLAFLDLSFNKLFGEIPAELAMSRSMEVLILSNNNLSGKILPAIFTSISVGLYLGGNNFDGEIPDVPTNTLEPLRCLNLSNNGLSGEIPRWMWNMQWVEILDLSSNNLQGLIPMDLCNDLHNLELLDLSHNNLSGYVPFPSCFSPPYIAHVHLRQNRLSGSMAHAFSNTSSSSSLVTLDLGENNITGEIPDWIGSLSALSILLLKGNQLNDEIPVQLCQLNSLSILDLSQNKLSGSIPSCLSNFTIESSTDKSSGGFYVFPSFLDELTDMGIKFSDMDGRMHRYSTGNIEEERIIFSTKRFSYPYKGNILNYFSGIDLSCNRLTGQIPPEMGNMSQVRSLNLSWNNLSGPIPSTFSKLEKIESLDLSHNSLNGTVPPQLTEINTLAIFTVAYNNLSGPLPDMKAQFGTFDESNYEGNPLLCGPPLENSCTEGDSPNTPSSSSRTEEEEEEGFMDVGVFYITFVVSYAIVLLAIAIVLYINPYWRRAWFYFVEQSSNTCYYFIVDTIHRLPYFRRNI